MLSVMSDEKETESPTSIEDEYVIVDLPPAEPKSNKDSYILQTALEQIESWKSAHLSIALIGKISFPQEPRPDP